MTNPRDAIEAELEDLHSLVRHPGWARFAKRIEGQAENWMAAMRNAKQQEDLLKATYTYLALHDLTKGPDQLIAVLTEQLKRHPK